MNVDNLDHETQSMAGFRDVLGFSITEWEPGWSVITAPVQDHHMNRNGVVHGGVFVSLLDSAAGLCGTYCKVPGNIRRCITVALNTQFINPVTDGVLRVESKMVSRGRKMFFVEGRVICDDILIATAQGTLRYIRGGDSEEGTPI